MDIAITLQQAGFKKQKPVLITFAALVLISLISTAFAHKNNIVHPGLTNAAISTADIPEITAHGFFDLSTDDQCSFIDEGSVKEDRLYAASTSWEPSIWGESTCGVGVASWMNHCYNPVTGEGWWIGGDDTLTYAVPIWDQALWDYAYGNPNNAFFRLGRICHLLEDMTSPAHAHGDVHWPEPEDFEDWGEANFNSYNFSTVMPYIPSGTVTLPDSSQVPGNSIEGFLHSLAKFTYDLSAFQGHLEEVEGTQPDSELARMFPTLHYYDAGILGDSYWEIDDIGRFETIFSDQWWACDSDYTEDNGGAGGARRIIGNFYIENSAGDSGTLTPAVFEKTGVYEANPNTKTLLEIYGDVLFPETVSYVAGLFYIFTDTLPDTVGVLSSPSVQPLSGGTNTNFQFSVLFTDTDNDPPDAGSVKLVLDSVEYVMTTTDTDYSDGSLFVYPSVGGIQLSQGSHQYYFEAKQNSQHVQGSPTGTQTLNVDQPSAGQVTVGLSPNPVEVFQSTTVTATVKDSYDNPLQGVTVDFSQNGFPGVMNPTSDTTDASGHATSTFTPNASGSALISAQVSGGASGSSYLTVNPGSVTFELTFSPAGGNAYQFQAKLLNNGTPWQGENVTLTLSPGSLAYFNRTGTATFSTTTNSGGYAQDGGSSVVDVTTTDYGLLTVSAEHDVTGVISTIITNISDGSGTTFEAFKDLGYSGADVDWSGNGNLVAIKTSGNSTYLIKDMLGTHQLWQTINTDCGSGRGAVIFSPDSSKIFTSGEGNNYEMAVLTLNYPSGSPSITANDNGHGKIEHRACDWAGSRILTGRTNDPECEVYNTSLSSVCGLAFDMTDDVTAVAFDKTNSSRFVFGDWDGIIKAGTTSCSVSWSSSAGSGQITSAGWYGNNVVVGDNTGVIHRYNASGSSQSNLTHGTGNVTATEFSPDGQWLATCGGGGIKIWSTSSWSVAYTGPSATVVAWDPTSTYLVDNNGKLYAPFNQIPPTIIISSPPDGYETYTATVDVIGTITGPLGISSATITVNGGPTETLTLGPSGDFTHPVSLSLGANTIRVDASGGGKSSYSEITVTRLTDVDGPVISSVTVLPSTDEIGTIFNISAYVIDAFSSVNAASVTCYIQLPDETDVATLQMYDDGTNGDATPSDSVYTCEWDSTGATEDSYLIDITASDVPGNPSEAENVQTLIVYDLPSFGTPTVAPPSPTDTNDVTITINITDPAGISSQTLWYQHLSNPGWIPVAMTGSGPSYSGTIPMMDEGTVQYKAEATDGLGHTGESIVYSYGITDASAPVAWNWSRKPVDITASTTGPVIVSVDVIDVGGSGLAGNPQMDYRISDGTFDGWEPMTAAGGITWTFAIPDLGWGASAEKFLEYKVTAVDKLGNELITPVQTELIDDIPAYLYVDDDAPDDPGPGDPSVSDPLEDGTMEHPYDSIQEAIDVAIDGDTVIVAEGTYYENLNLNDMDIILTSTEAGNQNVVANTIVNGGGNDSVINFINANVTIAGFTITNGFAAAGGGIYSENSDLTISDCIFSGNSAYAVGGGMLMFGEENSAILSNCIFTGNSAEYGGAIAMSSRMGDNNATLVNCLFFDNSAVFFGGVMDVWNLLGSMDIELINCTLAGNSAPNGNALSFDSVLQAYPSNLQVSNCILWNGNDEIWNGDGSTITINYSDIQSGWGGPGENNINVDPNFVDADNGDFHLQSDSPCIDAGDNSALPPDTADLDGDGNTTEPIPWDLDGNLRIIGDEVDMGCYEYVPAPENQAPVLMAIGDKFVSEDSTLIFDVNATDPDGDQLIYSVQNLPNGATFSGQTFSWTPSYEQAGSYQVTFIASDGNLQDSETITITVNNVNRAPVLDPIDEQFVNENSVLTFDVNATDPDGDPITYSVQSLPSGATLDPQTGDFAWTPSYEQAGSYQVTFIASDGQDQDFETITITVINVNRPPVLTAIDNKSAYADVLLTFTIDANDPDGDTITYSSGTLPSGATFTGQTFDWTPSQSQEGSYAVPFFASDGQLQDSETVTITVDIDNLAPTVTNLSPQARSIQVPLNNMITLHITDAGTGVDAATVTIEVNGNLVYTGDTAHYNSLYGDCRRTGTRAAYSFFYQSNETFDYDQTVTITVNATDLAGNAMSEHSYSFVTEMRSFGQNKKVNSGLDNNDKPVTVCDSSGNIWAAWHAGPIGNRDIYVSKLAAGEENFGDTVQLTGDATDQCNPAVALDSNDKLYVVWQDNKQGNWDIYISTSDDGINWSSETMVHDPNDRHQVNPDIVIDSQNNAYVVWQDDREDNQDIFVATSSDGFVNKTVSQITSDIFDQVEPAVAADSANTIYVVWTDGRNSSNDIYGAASNNGPWTNVAIVSNANNQSSPVIAAESAGSILHLLWVEDTSGDNDIYYASSNGLLDCPLTGGSIIDEPGTDQLDPTIAVTGSTGNNLKVFACWQDWRNTDTDLYFVDPTSGSGTNVFVGDDGSNSYQGGPVIGIDEYDHPYLIWADSRGTNTDIYYAGSTSVEPVPLASELVLASDGATVGTDPASINDIDDVSVVIPAGACSYDVEITISKINNHPSFAAPCLGGCDFGPSGIQFSQPVTITIPYAFSSSDGSATPYWFNSLSGALSQQGITDVQDIVISPTLHALSFKTTHFTAFYLLGDAAFTLNVSVYPEGSGSVTKILDKDSYSYNENVTLTAIDNANTWYSFRNWSGDLSGSNNPTTIVMDSDKSITANFVVTGNGIIGDFCGANSDQPDGYVDYWDLLYFAQRWHTRPGDNNWDPRCDLDKEDNYVDYWDLLVFAQQWHKGVKP